MMKPMIKKILKNGSYDFFNNYSDSWTSEELEEMITISRFSDTKWMIDNLVHQWQHTRQSFIKVSDAVRTYDGYIVEVAAGPTGGFASAYLVDNPHKKVIISDISTNMCERWSKVLSTTIYENACSIPVNVCNMPFEDATIDVISSRHGLINIESNTGTFIEAIDEVYRVLKKGGLFVMMEFVLTNESLQSLTEIHKSILNKKSPSIFEDLVKKCGEAGFNLIENIVYNVWSNKEDKSDLADICRHLNIELKFEEILFIFKK